MRLDAEQRQTIREVVAPSDPQAAVDRWSRSWVTFWIRCWPDDGPEDYADAVSEVSENQIII